ncbi:hypothetical protein WDU94_014387 [Cyamophila willieti]
MSKTYEDQSELCNILLKWLQTFTLEAPHHTLADITDGVAMAQALHQIAPEWFSEMWLAKIKTDIGVNNWRLKISNLKKINEGIVDYFQEYFDQTLGEFGKVDVHKIVENIDAKELARLMQLILGCAINCNRKQNYITKIMEMEESVQQVIMQSIQELENLHGSTHSLNISLDPQVQQLVAELQTVIDARDQMAQRCMELDMQVSMLQEEKSCLVEEKRRLEDRFQENFVEPTNKGNTSIRRQMDALKEELFKAESARDDYRIKLEIQSKQMEELEMKLNSLEETAGEARYLKDEVDILRETAEKVEKYEGIIETYKKKADELVDLKKQVKQLETKNLSYIQQTLDLEEELKKNGNWKSQVEMYKKQMNDLYNQFNEETKRADKSEFENEKLQEKVASLQREKEKLIVERDSLKETNEELKCCQLQESKSNELNTLGQNLDITEDTIPITELRQKLVRLTHENNMLKMNQKDDIEAQLNIVNTKLDDATQQVKIKTLENRKANQKILELEAELKERDTEDTTGMKVKILELQNENKNLKEQTNHLQEEHLEQGKLIEKLQDSITQKDSEIQDYEEKNRKYIEKASTAFKMLDPQPMQNIAAMNELKNLRKKNDDKDKMLDDLEKTLEKKDQQEKLIATAFYNLAVQKHRQSVDNRLASISFSQQPQSFLTKQRQASRRSVRPVAPS